MKIKDLAETGKDYDKEAMEKLFANSNGRDADTLVSDFDKWRDLFSPDLGEQIDMVN